MKQDEAVVFIHGIWMKGFELFYLAHGLKRQGYQVYHFRYKSLLRTPAQNASLLNEFLSRIKQPVIHLVCHSFGGILVMHLFSQHPQQKPGKVIMLGSPVKGSAAAKHIVSRPWLKWLLGKSIKQGLLGDQPAWNQQRDVYMIAGRKNIGMGMLLASKAMSKLNDGTVNLEETMAPFISQRSIVPHTHFTMLWSGKVLQDIKGFLTGRQV